MKQFLLIFLLLAIMLPAKNNMAQKSIKEFYADELTEQHIIFLQKTYGHKKWIPMQYRKQILTALSFFPELKNIAIEFRIKQTRKSPLTTIPSFFSIFSAAPNRKYIITICNLETKRMKRVLFTHLPYNAQVGVIGHELSHVADFNSKSTLQLLANGIEQLSNKYTDRFEYKTDSICIAHGLGYQLLNWSVYVHRTLYRPNWIGDGSADERTTKRERYMNPSTILKRIQADSIYKSVN